MKENILNLEIGKVYELGDIWDGNGEEPTESYSYRLKQSMTDVDYGAEDNEWVDAWVNYEFEFVNAEDKEKIENEILGDDYDVLSVPVKLTNIERI